MYPAQEYNYITIKYTVNKEAIMIFYWCIASRISSTLKEGGKKKDIVRTRVNTDWLIEDTWHRTMEGNQLDKEHYAKIFSFSPKIEKWQKPQVRVE